MSSPKRVQLKRTKGWRIKQAHSVARPTRWGNPYRWEDYRADYEDASDAALRRMATSDFRGMLEGKWGQEHSYPTVRDIRVTLHGQDLACWCPLDQPCHADVLLEIANAVTLR